MKAPVVYTGSVSSLRNARARLERIRLGANAMAAMGVGPLRQTDRAAAKLAEAEFEVLMNCLACRGRVTARVRLGGTYEPGGHVCAECAAELPAAVTGALLAGHELRADSPESMAAWTCQTCGDAVLVRPDGSAYGSATGRGCPGLPERVGS